MVIMNKTDGLFFFVLFVMRITCGTEIKDLLFLPMERDARPKTKQTELALTSTGLNLPREGRNAHELPHG